MPPSIFMPLVYFLVSNVLFLHFPDPWKTYKLFTTSQGFLYLQPLLSSHIVGDKLHWMKFCLVGDFSLTASSRSPSKQWLCDGGILSSLASVNPSRSRPRCLAPPSAGLQEPSRGCTCELRVNNSVKWQGALVSNVKCPLSNKFITHEYVLRDQRNDYAGDLWQVHPGLGLCHWPLCIRLHKVGSWYLNLQVWKSSSRACT